MEFLHEQSLHTVVIIDKDFYGKIRAHFIEDDGTLARTISDYISESISGPDDRMSILKDFTYLSTVRLEVKGEQTERIYHTSTTPDFLREIWDKILEETIAQYNKVRTIREKAEELTKLVEGLDDWFLKTNEFDDLSEEVLTDLAQWFNWTDCEIPPRRD